MADWQAGEVWRAILGDLQLQVTKPVFETWLKDTAAISFSDDLLSVGVPTPFAIEWLERRMYQSIHATARRVVGRPVDLRFRVGPEPLGMASGEPAAGNRPSGPNIQPRLVSGVLNDKYTFNRFVVGPSNRLPDSAARAVAEAPGQSYNPLFIYSGVGLGKTHLLHAIGHTCVSKGLSFIYVTCEQFTNEFIGSIRNRTTEEFRNKYRNTKVLLIDDIQFINGKEQTQEVFFHTFNDLHNSNRQVVLTADRPPNALDPLEDRLRSRFGWGLVADIQPPDLETRIAIIRNKAQQMHLDLEDSVVELVARTVRRNVRDLEGSLNRILALSRSLATPITTGLASQALADLLYESSIQAVDPDRIVDAVTRVYRVSRENLVGSSRRKALVRARHVAMYMLRHEGGMGDTDIGRALGNRAHSTVISAIAKVEGAIEVDPGLRREILAVKETIFS